MKNLVILYAGYKSDYCSKELLENITCKEFALSWAFSVWDFAGLSIYVDSEEKKNQFLELINKNFSEKLELVKFCVNSTWKVKDLISQIKVDSENFDNIVYGHADCPFYNSQITKKLLELHTESLAEYCFADGYPAGLTPEILHPGTVKILDSLCNLENSTDGTVLNQLKFLNKL